MVAGLTSTVFINEFHYDNTGTDAGEFIEIANTSGTNLAGWSIVLYEGEDGKAYATHKLTGAAVLTVLSLSVNGLQNAYGKPADGIALVDAAGKVVQFLSYEGTFTAKTGPANKMTSTDVGVFETPDTPVGHSLQLYGTGTTYGDFSWHSGSANTSGKANVKQEFPVKETTITGDKGGNELTGQDGSKDLIVGEQGNDILSGMGADDFILGNKDDDTLDGGDGADTLYGGTQNDTLFGGAGDDRLNGDKHDDKLYGGKGADTFVYNKAFGIDYLGDFEDGIDHIEFSTKVFKSFEDVKGAMTQEGSDVVITSAKGDVLTIANTTTDMLTEVDFLFV